MHNHTHPSQSSPDQPTAALTHSLDCHFQRQDKHAIHQALWGALILTSVFFAIELTGGLWFKSLALVADAGHMATDAFGLGMAVLASKLAQRTNCAKHTYGLGRVEVLASLLNGGLLIVTFVWVLMEALQRFQSPPEIHGPGMMAVSLAGLIVNVLVLTKLHPHHHDDLNTRGAYLHVMGDLLGSVGAVVASICVVLWGWTLADPILSIIVSGLLIVNAWRLLREALDVFLESAPAKLDIAAIEDALAHQPGVVNIHDLHVWRIGSQQVALSAHVTVTPEYFVPETFRALEGMMLDHFRIDHTTIQLEPQCLPSSND